MPRQKGSEEKDAGEAGEIPIDQRVHGIDGSAGKKGNGANSQTMKRQKAAFLCGGQDGKERKR